MNRLLFLPLLLAACARVPPRPEASLLPGQILDARLSPLSDDAFVRRANAARFVLVGESHPNRCDHAVQAFVVRVLGSSGRWTTGLEMVAVDKQPVLDRFFAGEVNLVDLAAALAWSTGWGFDFALYEPIFAAARDTSSHVVALNLPESVIHALRDGRPDDIPENLRSLVVPEVLSPSEQQLAFLREAFDAHPHGGEEGWKRFLYVQSLWDSQMAWRAAKASERLGHPVIVLAGTGHVLHGWGIARRLRVFAPDAPVLSLVPWRGDIPPDANAGDLFFYCPDGGE